MLSCPSQLIYGRTALSKPLIFLGAISAQIDYSPIGTDHAVFLVRAANRAIVPVLCRDPMRARPRDFADALRRQPFASILQHRVGERPEGTLPNRARKVGGESCLRLVPDGRRDGAWPDDDDYPIRLPSVIPPARPLKARCSRRRP